jgi:hypothetical protein
MNVFIIRVKKQDQKVILCTGNQMKSGFQKSQNAAIPPPAQTKDTKMRHSLRRMPLTIRLPVEVLQRERYPISIRIFCQMAPRPAHSSIELPLLLHITLIAMHQTLQYHRRHYDSCQR